MYKNIYFARQYHEYIRITHDDTVEYPEKIAATVFTAAAIFVPFAIMLACFECGMRKI
jgi:hypothetical protein